MLNSSVHVKDTRFEVLLDVDLKPLHELSITESIDSNLYSIVTFVYLFKESSLAVFVS